MINNHTILWWPLRAIWQQCEYSRLHHFQEAWLVEFPSGRASGPETHQGYNFVKQYFLKQCLFILLLPVHQLLSVCDCKWNFYEITFEYVFMKSFVPTNGLMWVNASMLRLSGCLSKEHSTSFSPLDVTNETNRGHSHWPCFFKNIKYTFVI